MALAVIVLSSHVVQSQDKKADGKAAVLDFKMKTIDGKDTELSQYKGKVVMFVNVASQCGLTPQYKGLQALYAKYKDKGLVIIGVPANEFGGQEPGSDDEIAKFCSSKYDVTFPMLSKVVVKGKGTCPLYAFLTSKDTNPRFGGDIQWNFTKFLVNRKGEVVNRFEPRVAPESTEIVSAIEAELAKK
jgi:glutathione peroxidase